MNQLIDTERLYAYIDLGTTLEEHGVTLDEIKHIARGAAPYIGGALRSLGITLEQSPRTNHTVNRNVRTKKLADTLSRSDDPPADQRTKLEDLDLSPRVYFTLEREGFGYIDQLTRFTERELRIKIRGIGPLATTEIRTRLSQLGLALKS